MLTELVEAKKISWIEAMFMNHNILIDQYKKFKNSL